MDGDVDGARFAVNDALKLGFREIGQRHEVAGHEGKAPVVIADVQAFTHMGRHLLDKAEDTVIGTGLGAAHEGGLKHQAEGRAGSLVDEDLAPGAIGVNELYGKRGAGCQKLIVHQVQNGHAVDTQERITAPDTGVFADRSGRDLYDALRHKRLLWLIFDCIIAKLRGKVKV